MGIIKFIKVINIIFLTTVVISCKKSKLSKIYFISEIIDKSNKGNVELCFKSSLLVFDDKSSTLKFPGFNKPVSKGNYNIIEDKYLEIYDMDECYFEGSYSIQLIKKEKIKFIILEDARMKMFCKEIDFKNAGIDQSVYKRLLNNPSLYSENCIEFRHNICCLTNLGR